MRDDLRELARVGMDVGRPSALVRELAAALLASQEQAKALGEECYQRGLTISRLECERDDLLAAAYQAKALAEALAKALQLSSQGTCETGSIARGYLVQIEALTLKALRAYREAGRGKG